MILGVDLGKKTTGLAISGGEIASPYSTITHKNINQAVGLIVQTIELNDVDTVVVGFVEGKIKSLFDNFVRKLREKKPDLVIVLWDETLTTRQARDYLIKQQVGKKKRGKKEHETAAAIILQSYLDR